MHHKQINLKDMTATFDERAIMNKPVLRINPHDGSYMRYNSIEEACSDPRDKFSSYEVTFAILAHITYRGYEWKIEA